MNWLCGYMGPPCSSEDDCAAGAECQWAVDAAVSDFLCTAKPSGTRRTGETCDPAGGVPDQSCAAFCLSYEDGSRCAGPCATDQDCIEGTRCIGTYLQSAEQTKIVGLCQSVFGSDAACAKDADCTVDGELCALRYDREGGLVGRCRAAFAGGGAIGAACYDDRRTVDVAEPYAPCESTLCFGYFDGARCTTLCESVADCPSDGDWTCREVTAPGDSPVTACMAGAACARDADCSGGDVCMPESIGDHVEGRCGAPFGPRVSGDACDLEGINTPCGADADCSAFGTGWTCAASPTTRRCHPPAAETCTLGTACISPGTCTAMCTGDADCGAAVGIRCAASPQRLFDSLTPSDGSDDLWAPLPLCVVYQGSLASCARDEDCSGGELCGGMRALDGTLSTVCLAPYAAGAATGELCGDGVGGCRHPALCDVFDGDNNVTIGTCTEPCVTDVDCPAPTTCRDYRDTPLDETPLRMCRMPGAVDDFSD